MGYLFDYRSFDNLLKIKQENTREFISQARILAIEYVKNNKLYTALRIAKELQELYCDTEDIEHLIAESGNPNYIFRFAKELRNSNVNKLQEAIVATKDNVYIAKFACFVNGANSDLLEEIVISANNAKAVYIFLRSGKFRQLLKIRNIIIKSKKPRYLYKLAQFISNLSDIELIENMIINSRSSMYIRLFAANITNANIEKLENYVINTRNFDEMKKFVASIPSKRISKLLILI